MVSSTLQYGFGGKGRACQTVRSLGRDVPVLPAEDGTVRTEHYANPAPARSAQSSYIARAFGGRLGEARAAMEALSASLPPEERNRIGATRPNRTWMSVGTLSLCRWATALWLDQGNATAVQTWSRVGLANTTLESIQGIACRTATHAGAQAENLEA